MFTFYSKLSVHPYLIFCFFGRCWRIEPHQSSFRLLRTLLMRDLGLIVLGLYTGCGHHERSHGPNLFVFMFWKMQQAILKHANGWEHPEHRWTGTWLEDLFCDCLWLKYHFWDWYYRLRYILFKAYVSLILLPSSLLPSSLILVFFFSGSRCLFLTVFNPCTLSPGTHHMLQEGAGPLWKCNGKPSVRHHEIAAGFPHPRWHYQGSRRPVKSWLGRGQIVFLFKIGS